MFGMKKKKEVKIQDGLVPCLSGLEIFEIPTFKNYLTNIKSLVSCTNDVYHQVYLPVLYKLSEYCQAMPFSRDSFNASYGLLERQLKLTVAVLSIRRGILLPKNDGAEAIAAQEAHWTYALFTTSLLTDIFITENDRTIRYHYPSGELFSEWSPLSGSLYEKDIFYSLRFLTQNLEGNKPVFMTALASRIIPPTAFRWLAGNPTLFTKWWDAILHQDAASLELCTIIQKAKDKLGFLSKTNSVKSTIVKIHLQFLTWLAERIILDNENVIRCKTGLFVDESLINEFLQDYKSKNETSISKIVFIQELEKAKLLVLNKNDFIHSLYPKRLEDKRLPQGFMFNTEFLPGEFERLPFNTYYLDSKPF